MFKRINLLLEKFTDYLLEALEDPTPPKSVAEMNAVFSGAIDEQPPKEK